MREIKFRGRKGHNVGKWIFGNCIEQDRKNNVYYLAQKDAGFYPQQWIEIVEQDTIGQFPGLIDCNGNDIYEGDIISFSIFDSFGGRKQFKGFVKFCDGMFEIWRDKNSKFYGCDGAFSLARVYQQDDELEIIGNIYDNPELLNQ